MHYVEGITPEEINKLMFVLIVYLCLFLVYCLGWHLEKTDQYGLVQYSIPLGTY